MNSLRIWPPTALPAALRRPARRLPYPLEQPGCRLYQQARQALHDCLPALGVKVGDEALVPRYHHGSEVQALLKAGVDCLFYAGQPDLQPDEDELELLLGPRTRVLHLIHYLGFPQDVARWRRWCDRHGLLLVEDAAQAWLVERDDRPIGSFADLAVFCLYKTYGLPDGAAAVGRVALPAARLPGRLGALDLARPALHGLRQQLQSAGLLRCHDPDAYDQAQDVAVPDVARAAGVSSRWLAPRVADHGTAAARRHAYSNLQRALDHLVPLPFQILPQGASPFVFPVAVADKEQALKTLRAAGIEGLDLWSRPHPSMPSADAETPGEVLRRTVVGLPVHQGLTSTDLDRIRDAARSLAPARQRATSSLVSSR